ncbi:MAG: hypothetical protein ACI9CD_000083 [Candidatus Deianiraeaceae bacterium]|jgi:hypothetical protein
MLRKIKAEWREFVGAREQIAILEDKVKFVSKLNESLYIVVNRVAGSYVDFVINKENANANSQQNLK